MLGIGQAWGGWADPLGAGLYGKLGNMVKYTGWSKLCISQQERVTNLIISQHCLTFKYMTVSILGKCIIKIQDLPKVLYYTGCMKLKL